MTYRNRSCSSHRRITIDCMCSPPQFPFLSSAPREDGPNLNCLHFSCCSHRLHHVPWLSIFNKLYPAKILTDRLLSGVPVDLSKALMITAKEIIPVFQCHYPGLGKLHPAWSPATTAHVQLGFAGVCTCLERGSRLQFSFFHFLYLSISKINRF